MFHKFYICMFCDPDAKNLAFLAFNFNPEMFEKLSIILTKVSKDCLDPSIMNAASSAKSEVLNSLPFICIPLTS